MAKSYLSTTTKTPQSGSKPAYVEPVYTKSAATISQKLRNNKGGPPSYDSSGVGGGSPGGGTTTSRGKKQGD